MAKKPVQTAPSDPARGPAPLSLETARAIAQSNVDNNFPIPKRAQRVLDEAGETIAPTPQPAAPEAPAETAQEG